MNQTEDSLTLSEEIIKNIELQEISLSNIVLRCARLARITRNQQAMDLFKYELTGYPKDDKGYILADAFQLAKYANRSFRQKDQNSIIQEYMFTETVSEIENELLAARDQMKVAFDRNISISSANPNQFVIPPTGNVTERSLLRQIISKNSKKLDQLKTAYYNYVLGVYYEIKFKNIIDDIFQKRKIILDKTLSKNLPETFKKLVSAYDNLKSENYEDWANAVHSCRRVIKDIADFLYPSTDEEIKVESNNKIKLNDKNYIARLKQFIKEKSNSKSFAMVIGSNLDFIGNRIDTIHKATTKGSHTKVEKKEAESYVMYTYMLMGDVMDLYITK